ncbi:MAG: tRNA (adenosine(37)-N6)-dimethylallyltransferase MiaA [Deltaproteobacteria bacterium]|nr:tRNA (adenosine(37)-N6)-dimethylallyltransferase MiaA [Candidatus Zymogenaceae bacterium]
MTLQKIVIITGPTASGKSAVAAHIAEQIGGRIVSADSAAVYRYLDIGTAKPTPDERARVGHHLVDIIDPDRQCNAMAYVQAADSAVGEIVADGFVPVVAGGAGLYIKALVYGIFDQAGESDQRRAIRRELEVMSTELLRGELERADAESSRRIGRGDRVRLIRALEIYRMTGVTKSEMAARHGFAERRYDALAFGLSMERGLLYERIDRRVEEMIARGIVRETREILERGYGPQSPGLSTIGYKEIVDYLAGKTDLEKAIFLIKRNTRRYAKRQMTWFRKMEGIRWIEYPYDIVRMIREIQHFIP